MYVERQSWKKAELLVQYYQKGELHNTLLHNTMLKTSLSTLSLSLVQFHYGNTHFSSDSSESHYIFHFRREIISQSH